MKEEKYMKALGIHEAKLLEYAMRLDDLVLEMGDDKCSVLQVVGMLECAKAKLLGAADETARLFGELLDSED